MSQEIWKHKTRFFIRMLRNLFLQNTNRQIYFQNQMSVEKSLNQNRTSSLKPMRWKWHPMNQKTVKTSLMILCDNESISSKQEEHNDINIHWGKWLGQYIKPHHHGWGHWNITDIAKNQHRLKSSSSSPEEISDLWVWYSKSEETPPYVVTNLLMINVNSHWKGF